MKVGTICKLKVDCLGNKAGTLGVVFYNYGDGVQVIFENGRYDGFSITHGGMIGEAPFVKRETAQVEADYFLEEVGFEESLAGYHFKNVMQVSEDYKAGVFNIAWSEGWKVAVKANVAETKCTCDLNSLVSGSGLEGDPMIIHYCPLHEAAPALLRCCKRYIRMQEEVYEEMGKKPTSTTYYMMKEAVAECEKNTG